MIEASILFLIVIAAVVGIAVFLNNQEKSEPKAPPVQVEPQTGSTFPCVLPPQDLPIQPFEGPALTWQDVSECELYAALTDELFRGDKDVLCVENVVFLFARNTNKSATTIHRRWRWAVGREGLSRKKELSVSVLGRNSYVEQSHHCTRSGSH